MCNAFNILIIACQKNWEADFYKLLYIEDHGQYADPAMIKF